MTACAQPQGLPPGTPLLSHRSHRCHQMPRMQIPAAACQLTSHPSHLSRSAGNTLPVVTHLHS